MSTRPTIASVMTPSPISIEIGESVEEAQLLMSTRNVRHLPVTVEGTLVSIVTDRDLNLAVAANKDLTAARHMLVSDVCAMELYKVDVETPLEEVVAQMAKRSLGSAVVTKDGALAGIFTAIDACRCLAQCLHGELGEL